MNRSVLGERALGVRDPNTGGRPERFRVIGDKLRLPSLAEYPSTQGQPQSPFESWRGDDDWATRLVLWSLTGSKLNKWFKQEKSTFRPHRSYPYDFVFDGKENWSASEAIAVSEVQVVSLLTGACDDFSGFLCAEGQFARLLLTEPDHQSRLVVLKVWALLIHRYCGTDACKRIFRGLDRLAELSTYHACCLGSRGGGMFRAFSRYSGTMLQLQQVWHYVCREVDAVRERYFGDFAFSADVCAMHKGDCYSFAEKDWEGPLDWESTRENTPEESEPQCDCNLADCICY